MNLWDSTKQSYMYIIGTPEEEEREIREEKVFKELMAPVFPIMIKNFQPTDPRRSMNVKPDKHIITPDYIIVKWMESEVKRKP